MTQAPRVSLTARTSLRMNLGLAASVKVLAQDSFGLRRYLEEQAATNPVLRIEPAERAPRDWLPRWSAAFSRAEGGAAETAAHGPSLAAHLSDAITLHFPSGRVRRAAELFADAVEPSGWLGRPLSALAAEAGLTLPEAEALLARLQDIEPAGLFARNLAECLVLQAREAGWLDPPMELILSRLDLLAAGETARLARLARVPEAEILSRLRRIRSLNPKPGAQFDPGAAPLREPDLEVRRGSAGWMVELNRSSLPALSVVALPRGPRDAEQRAQVAAARALMRQVDARGRTILRVGQEVLQRQAAALDNGLGALMPMTMAEVADALGLHVSTVSRAVAGTAVDTPRGTWWLRRLFTQTVGQGEGIAAGAVRAALAELVAGEDRKHPLSDAALAEALGRLMAEPGADLLARRTAAKYRASLGIPPAHRRRAR